jgi:hypothetical protein
MAWDEIILMGANQFRGPLEGVGPEIHVHNITNLKIETFLGLEMATCEASAIWTFYVHEFQGPPLPMALQMDLSPSKSLPYVPRRINNRYRYINNSYINTSMKKHR